MNKNIQQHEYWNGPAGKKWAILADKQDTILGPLGKLTMEAINISPGQNIIDIGCGSGHATLDLARKVQVKGEVAGFDISRPMLAIARKRAFESGIPNVKFYEADVTTFDFSKASFDCAFSRFGVMFFENPIMSFSNFARGIKKNGAIAFCCWQGLSHNEWFEIPLKVGLRHCPDVETNDPNAPGPLAFKDKDRVNNILVESGFDNVTMQDHTSQLILGPTPILAAKYLLEFGPLNRLLSYASESVKQLVKIELERELGNFISNSGVQLNCSIWIVAAEKK